MSELQPPRKRQERVPPPEQLRQEVLRRTIAIALCRHKAKLDVGISDGIVSSALLELALHQRVTTPGDY
jgi:hypothetical protein